MHVRNISNSGFRFGDTSQLRKPRSICILNFDNIAQYYYFRFGRQTTAVLKFYLGVHVDDLIVIGM